MLTMFTNREGVVIKMRYEIGSLLLFKCFEL
jgi:hypothetical protein